MTRIVLLLAAIFAFALPSAASAERVRDIGQFQSVRSNQLTGYGIVVGLDGTGDDNFAYATQAMRGVSGRFGLQLPPGVNPALKNAAAVIITAELPAFAKPGQKIDITVSTMGKAKSLRGGALILTSADRAKDFPTTPVYLRGMGGESAEGPMISQMESFSSSRAFRVSGRLAFENAGITHSDVDHLMVYDAFAHLPIYGLEDLGFVKPGEGGAFIAEGNTRPGGKLPLNTNGGGLSCVHPGMYGIFTVIEATRQIRGDAPGLQIANIDLALAHGNGGTLSSQVTAILGSENTL